MDLSRLSGPIIGAVIGYGTNWIAIKMLFRPRKPIKIGKFSLPFTPGIIPKRKEKLARAIGEMVGNNLFTKMDMENMLLSEEVEDVVVRKILVSLSSEETIKSVLLAQFEEKEYLQAREDLKNLICAKIRDGLLQLQIGDLIVKEGGQVIRAKVKGGLLRMFVTDDLVDSFLKPMGSELEKYLEEQGEEKILPVVEKEMVSFENRAANDFVKYFDRKKLEDKIHKIYQNLVINQVSSLLEKLNIAGVVEEKINQMDVLELEKLLFSVMKKELGAIVNLGALIGLILGTLNMIL